MDPDTAQSSKNQDVDLLVNSDDFRPGVGWSGL